MEAYGIEDLKKIFNVLITFGNVAGYVWEDGKVTKSDMMYLGKLYPAFSDLLNTNWLLIVPEAKDLSQAEVEELSAFFADKFDIPQDKIELLVETGLSFIATGINKVVELINLVKALKAV